MADKQRLICSSADLPERGRGVKFPLPEQGEHVSGFVVRMNGKPHAYVNRCAHLPVELDWEENNFFDLTGTYLICATHGAHYDVDSGVCAMGPCKGKSLQPIKVFERDGNIFYNYEFELES